MNVKALPDVLLKRFLYLCREEPTFISGDPEIHGCFNKSKVTACEELLKSNKDDLTMIRNILEVANNEKLLTRRAPIFFALAICVMSENITNSVRHEIYTLVLNLCKSDEDFFCFIKFYTKVRKTFPSGLNKIIASYYFKKDPLELARNIALTSSYHGWKHKDIMKLAHCKTDSVVMEAIISYILYDMEKAKSVANENVEALEALKYISKLKEYKSCNDEKIVAQLIPELKISCLSQIPSSLNKSQPVWEALIPLLPLSELIIYLPKLYKLGFLKQSSNIHTKVIEILTDAERIKTSKIHPAEVFIGLRNFEKGGKPKDPKLVKYLESKEEGSKAADPDYKKPDFAHQEPAKCPAIMSALNKTLNASYINLRTTGKRIMVTIDVSSKMTEPCLTTKNVNALEAAALVALSLLKVEKNIILAVFSGNGINPVSIEKSATLNQTIKKLKEAKNDLVNLSAPFEWATKQNKSVDVFINIFFNISSLSKEHLKGETIKESFNNYRKECKLPNARAITYSLDMRNMTFGGGITDWLDIYGFDKNVPKIVEAFIRELF